MAMSRCATVRAGPDCGRGRDLHFEGKGSRRRALFRGFGPFRGNVHGAGF